MTNSPVDPQTQMPMVEITKVNRKTGDPERVFSPGTEAQRYDIAGTIKYIGRNKPGVAESDPSWTITKYDLTDSSNVLVTVAVDAVWTNRLTEAYT